MKRLCLSVIAVVLIILAGCTPITPPPPIRLLFEVTEIGDGQLQGSFLIVTDIHIGRRTEGDKSCPKDYAKAGWKDDGEPTDAEKGDLHT